MEKYRLKKDTIFYRAGTVCKLTPRGNLVLDDCEGTCVVSKHKLEEYPELLDEWFKKIEEQKYGGRVPKGGDEYWYIAGDGTILSSIWSGYGTVCYVDAARFESGSAFWTCEEAEKELKRRKAYVILKEDTKGFVPDWGNPCSNEYYVYYAHDGKQFGVDYRFCYQSGLIYFATREDAEASIKAHRQLWLDYLGIEEQKR